MENLSHHLFQMLGILLAVCSIILNLEAIVRQVAVNRGYKNVVSWCDRIASFINFFIEVFETIIKKKTGQTTLGILLLVCFILIGAGCASYSSHHTRITGSGTYIYDGLPITGNVVVDGYSCMGIKCPTINEVANGNIGPTTNIAK